MGKSEVAVYTSTVLGICSFVSTGIALGSNIFLIDLGSGSSFTISLLGAETSVDFIGFNTLGYVSFGNLEDYCGKTSSEDVLCENKDRWYAAGLSYFIMISLGALSKLAALPFFMKFLEQHLAEFRPGMIMNAIFTLFMTSACLVYLGLARNFNYSLLMGGVFMYMSGISSVLDSLSLLPIYKEFWNLDYLDLYLPLYEPSTQPNFLPEDQLNKLDKLDKNLSKPSRSSTLERNSPGLPIFLSDEDETIPSRQLLQESSFFDTSFDVDYFDSSRFEAYKPEIESLEAKNFELNQKIQSLNLHVYNLTLQLQAEMNDRIYLRQECERLRREIVHYKHQTEYAESECRALASEKHLIERELKATLCTNLKLKEALSMKQERVLCC
jgi:hypothetical protein